MTEKQRASQQAESFTATVSHEMNAPLGTVIFFVKSLESQVLSEDGTFDLDAVRMYFKFIFSCLMLVQTFANDLVDLR